jgi:hypothetical protein
MVCGAVRCSMCLLFALGPGDGVVHPEAPLLLPGICGGTQGEPASSESAIQSAPAVFIFEMPCPFGKLWTVWDGAARQRQAASP